MDILNEKVKGFNTSLLEDVFTAYYDARKHKRNTESQMRFEVNLECNLMDLYYRLQDRSYTPSPMVCFIVNKPVKREVFASQFVDRVIHHLLYNYISPIFEKYFIYDSYSCRKGKGTLFGIKRLQHHIRSCTNNYRNEAYVLKLDIQGYFMSINKQKLYGIVCRQLNEYWQNIMHILHPQQVEQVRQRQDLILFLLNKVIFKEPTHECTIKGEKNDWNGLPSSKSLFCAPKGFGLPIGDLTSQLFSNIYLGIFDNYAKRVLKLKHYGRYVDDFYVVHKSRGFLKEIISKSNLFLKEELGLTLHPNKIYLQSCIKGIEFLGIVIKPYRTYVSDRFLKQCLININTLEYKCTKASAININSLRMVRSIMNSYIGYMSRHKTYKYIPTAHFLNHISKEFCSTYHYKCISASSKQPTSFI